MQITNQAYKEGCWIVFLCSIWYTSSSGQNVINKRLLGYFPYPITISMVHMLCVALFLGPVLRLRKVEKLKIHDKHRFLMLVFPLAFGKFFASISSHLSIANVSVSFAHTVKAMMPIFTVILSRIIVNEKASKRVYLALATIIFGVLIATVTELTFNVIGGTFALIATITFSLQNVYTKKAIGDLYIHHLRLLLILGQLASLMLLPIWMYVDLTRIYNNKVLIETLNWPKTLLLLFLSGLLNFTQNIFAFSVISLISPLSYSIANATKRIVIITSSLIFLRNPVTPMNVFGMGTAIIGVLAYNKAKYDDRCNKQMLPVYTSDADLVHMKAYRTREAIFSNGHSNSNYV
ncbi:solute carrier family 35 member E1-like [Anneissia japonica]|uniref:solute carrier family 35 member E1-like n=1 Tax=Anneissia japonica TaxID=1529436 RepID=UPI001425B36B|nr:solute carrier family 35 member E1-like [Anneissia japonica]